MQVRLRGDFRVLGPWSAECDHGCQYVAGDQTMGKLKVGQSAL